MRIRAADKVLLRQVFRFVYASATEDESGMLSRMDEFSARVLGGSVREQYAEGIAKLAGPPGRMRVDGTWEPASLTPGEQKL